MATENALWYVSTAMVRSIEVSLDHYPVPRWIRFVDLTGARVRLQSRTIEYVAQSTEDQRAIERAFFRARRRERKVDSTFDDD